MRALTQSQPAQSRSIVSPPRDHRDPSLSQHKSTISEVLMQLRFKKLLIKFLKLKPNVNFILKIYFPSISEIIFLCSHLPAAAAV